MTSHPPAPCCIIGVKHEGTPTGELKDIEETSVYFAYPGDKATENCVLILTDVNGHKFVNIQLIADQFAANGYFTVIPDLFHGDPAPLNRPEDFDVSKWRQGHLADRVDPVVATVIRTLIAQHSVKRIGAVGYCFGAKYVGRFLGSVGREKNASVKVGVMNHPSYTEADELKAICGPLAINAAENDTIFPPEKRYETEGILKALSDGERKLAYQINLYSTVSHGFASRGNVKDKREKYAKEAAFLQAVQWFDTWLKVEG